MTDAPERIYTWVHRDGDSMTHVWHGEAGGPGRGKTEYIRADHALALVAEAYEVAAKKAEMRDHADGEKATEFDKGHNQACDKNASMIRYSTPSDALAETEGRSDG